MSSDDLDNLSDDLGEDLPDNNTIEDDQKSNAGSEDDKENSDAEEEEEKEEPLKIKADLDVDEEPPKQVVVQGPPKSGKTTQIKSLVKHYTKHSIKDPQGPITVRTGKHSRITLIECPNDMSSMADMAKVADLVLMTVDMSIGFEMETFEFASILQIHGFPRCLGVCTHMDFYKDGKQLKKSQRKMKRRFAFEVTKETKLFFVSGIQNGYYKHRDIINLARFISIVKVRNLEWKVHNPHLLVDRVEQLSDGLIKDNDQVEVSIFGYIRGGSYRPKDRSFLCGLGYCNITDVKDVGDPCPHLENKLEITKEEEYEE